MPYRISGGGQRTFQDTFNRASSSRLGNNWFVGTLVSTPIVNAIWSAQAIITTITGGIQGLSWQPIGNGSEQTSWPAVAVPLLLSGAAGKNQYSQIKRVKFSAGAGHDCATGPSVLADETGLYFFVLTGIAAEIGKLYKGNGSIRTQLHAGVSVNDGDVGRLEGTIAGSDVTLKAYINGVLQYTVVDAGSTLKNGLPTTYCYAFNEAQSGELYEFTNFDGGLLTG